MKITVKIVGWHSRWEKIASINAIRISSGCGLEQAKRVVDRALTEKFSAFEVEGLEEATRVSQKLADLGAIVSCGGVNYDSFQGDACEVPYRKEAVGTIIATGPDSEDGFSARLVRGMTLEKFDLSVPMNGSLDFRVGARLIKQTGHHFTFTIDCEDAEEREFWRDMLTDGDIEADIHKPE